MGSQTRNKLIAYAMHFASFLIERGIKARKIVLFGSVASGEFDEESDIDVFIDTEKSLSENGLPGLQGSFEKMFGEKWRLKGVTNQLSITVGDINSKKWDDLRRTMQSRGIVLYGQYSEPPKNIQPYLLFRLNFGGIQRSQKVSLWRMLYGYTQKVGSKKYVSKGLLEQLGGMKINKGIVLIPSAQSSKLKEFLRKSRISHSVVEVWSDQFRSSETAPYA